MSVRFLNDAWGGTPATDRNLYVTGATFNGAVIPGGAVELLSQDKPLGFGFTKAVG